MTDWHYDDLRQVGVDFEDTAAVDAYDRNQRGGAEQDRALVDQLGINGNHVDIDIGCGTGAFAVEAARRCRTVYAVDVSTSMLAFARRRATVQNLTNMQFRRGGFLSYAHDGLIERAGFRIDRKDRWDAIYGDYTFTKTPIAR